MADLTEYDVEFHTIFFEGPNREKLEVLPDGEVRNPGWDRPRRLVREDRRELLFQMLLAGYWMR